MIRKVFPISKPFAFPTRTSVFSQGAASTELVLDFLPPPLLQSFAVVTYWEVVLNGVEPFPDWRPRRLPTIHIKAPTMSSCSQGFDVDLAAQNVRIGMAVPSTPMVVATPHTRQLPIRTMEASRGSVHSEIRI